MQLPNPLGMKLKSQIYINPIIYITHTRTEMVFLQFIKELNTEKKSVIAAKWKNNLHIIATLSFMFLNNPQAI